MDAISRDLQKPIPWTLLYADYVMLASEDKGELEREVQPWCGRLERFGLKLNVKKTEYLTTDATEFSPIKSKIYRAVVRPVAMYGAECWPATKEVETRLSVMETKMLRWTAGVTRTDRIRNDAIRQKFGVGPIADKMWYGHVLRGKEDSVRKIGLNFEVIGKQPRGRPKQRWADTLHMDLKVAGVHSDLALIGKGGSPSHTEGTESTGPKNLALLAAAEQMAAEKADYDNFGPPKKSKSKE
ncbi:unnamed protein product [Heligmosomoides polygyrus]|uniref:Reverse transcriptase domain-containing protein n=1 Tax=Heligmosomoides polygyrus TaxID=6339 RepID=A0A183FRP9_HELPZ|nr:unnamed protein product [Heligmosomoides polygyrus]